MLQQVANIERKAWRTKSHAETIYLRRVHDSQAWCSEKGEMLTLNLPNDEKLFFRIIFAKRVKNTNCFSYQSRSENIWKPVDISCQHISSN